MEIYFTIISFIMGILLGSFFNVCIYRIPNNQSIVNPPSHCYNCNTRLKPLDLVPNRELEEAREEGNKSSARFAIPIGVGASCKC